MHVVGELTGEARVAIEFYLEDAGGPNLQKLRKNRVAQAKAELVRRKDTFKSGFDDGDLKLDDRIASLSVEEGHPAESILKKAGELGCDLIVMGTHEKGAIRTFLGSVARTVIANSKIPVLVVPLP